MGAKTGEHPPLEQLRAFGLGRLSATDSESIERHVAACDRCCQMLAVLGEDSLVALARQAAELNHCEGITRSFVAANPTLALADFVPTAGVPQALDDHPRYQVLERVGAGGMGVVFKAQHRFMDRVVALKVINPALMSNRSAVARFEREVRAAAKLNHPGIVTAFDADRAGDLHFLVMEYIDGVSLARLVEKKGPLPIGQACHFVRQAAIALQHAHLQGLVHRDIKPQNLMVTRKGQVKLLDLGLARLIDSTDSSDDVAVSASDSKSSLAGTSTPATVAARLSAIGPVTRATATSVVLGTPDYLAPEQAEDSRSVDIRADLYSLGCTLYFLLTGRVPFPEGNVYERLVQHKLDEPTPVEKLRPDLPSEIADVCKKLMAKSPDDRFQTPNDLASALAPHASLQASSISIERDEVGERRRADTLTIADADTQPDRDSGSPSKSPVRRTVRRERKLLQDNSKVYRWIGAAIAFQALLFGIAGLRSYLRNQAPAPPVDDSPPTLSASLADKSKSPSETTPTPPKSPRQKPQQPTPSTTLAPPTLPSGAMSNHGPPRVLFLLPRRQLWNEDYLPVRQRLESAGIVVQTASGNQAECWPDPASSMKQSIRTDLAIDDELLDDEFDAIVFVGFNVYEFVQKGPYVDTIRRLIERTNRNGKIVSAICVGQAVLAYHGALAGRQVARNQQLRGKMNYDSLKTVDRAVVVDGNIITGRHPDDATEFAESLATAVKKQSPRN